MTYEDMTLRDLTTELTDLVDLAKHLRLHAPEVMGILEQRLDDIDFMAIDWSDIGPIGEAAHWFICEGSPAEAVAAVGIFDAIASSHSQARQWRQDHYIQTGEWK